MQQSDWVEFHEKDFPITTIYGPEGEKYNYALFKGRILAPVSEQLRGLPTDTEVNFVKKYGLHFRVRKVRK